MSDPFYILVPIAIRDDETARIHIPEAEKIARVVLAYAPQDEAPPPSEPAARL